MAATKKLDNAVKAAAKQKKDARQISITSKKLKVNRGKSKAIKAAV